MNDSTLRARLQASEAITPAADDTNLLAFGRAISRRRWLVLALTLLGAILAATAVFSVRPTYRASATLLLEQGKSKVVSIEEVYTEAFANREHIQTQVEILKSEDLARKVVRKLNLVEHPDFRATAPAAKEEAFRRTLKDFRESLQIQLIRNSQLVQVSFVALDRELAARVPNAVAETYIESDLEARLAMTQRASEWLRERMGELRGKLEAAERALQDYRDREKIVDAKGVTLSGAGRQFEELSRNVVEARQKRAEAESAYAQVQEVRAGRGPISYETIPAVLRHPLVQRLQEQEAEAERKAGEAARRYGPEHPRMIQARSELESARESKNKQVEGVVAGLQKEYEAARANEQAVERALAQSTADIQSLNRKEFQLGVLEREVKQNRNLYELFVNRLKETSAAGGLHAAVARVVDPATLPLEAHSPRKVRVIVLATFFALVAAVLLALLLDRLNNTVQSTADVEQRLGIPVLGVLPKAGAPGRKGLSPDPAFYNDTRQAFAESVRTVRTGVLMSALDHPHKLVVVTSSVAGEGKTTLCFNLACALGQVKRVLLVDADLRQPLIGKLAGRDAAAPGLADLVAGQAPASQCVFRHEAWGIHVLAAGSAAPNPLDLLSSKRFDEAMAALCADFEVVVMDSAPLQLVSDALVLSRQASAVIYVVQAGKTPYPVAQNGLKRLRRVNAPVLGAVLTQLDLARAQRYHGEYGGSLGYKG